MRPKMNRNHDSRYGEQERKHERTKAIGLVQKYYTW